MFHPALEIIAHPGRPQPLAFEAEKSNLIERVDCPKPQVKFETVDDPDFVIEPNMFGPQVAMPFDDPPAANSCRDEIAAPFKKPALRSIDATHKAGGNAETRVE